MVVVGILRAGVRCEFDLFELDRPDLIAVDGLAAIRRGSFGEGARASEDVVERPVLLNDEDDVRDPADRGSGALRTRARTAG
jgi:hypothetical protein